MKGKQLIKVLSYLFKWGYHLNLILGFGMIGFTIINMIKPLKVLSAAYLGKFNLMVYGLPDGDTKMVLNIVKKDDKLTGTIGGAEQTDTPLELSGITVADSTLDATFIAQGMDISLFFKIKDDKNITGNMLNMFDIKGIKEK